MAGISVPGMGAGMFAFNRTPESACPFEWEPVQAAKYLKMLGGGMPDCRPTGIACGWHCITLGRITL
jgi:hypothetical protein